MQTRLGEQEVKYSFGSYNKFDDKEQWIRLTEGCPNNCPYCFEPQEFKIFDTPEIVRNDVKIMDMNLLAKPEAVSILRALPDKVNGKVIYYEMVCGIDYRYLTQEIADILKAKRFRKIRMAWDWFYKDQFKIYNAIKMLDKSGYRRNNIMIFMICNWKIPYLECVNKLDLCKVWNVQVSDCYFNNQTFPNVQPVFWTFNECKKFRRKCRKHNQLINFKIDPEEIPTSREGKSGTREVDKFV